MYLFSSQHFSYGAFYGTSEEVGYIYTYFGGIFLPFILAICMYVQYMCDWLDLATVVVDRVGSQSLGLVCVEEESKHYSLMRIHSSDYSLTSFWREKIRGVRFEVFFFGKRKKERNCCSFWKHACCVFPNLADSGLFARVWVGMGFCLSCLFRVG